MPEKEGVCIIPLRDAWLAPRKKRAKKAIRILHEYVQRHFHVKYVRISNDVNEFIWKRGIEKPPRRIKVKVTKTEEDLAEVELFKE
ncbi:MAG: 50S ribosomal protein L31e [Thermoprotei archaeon]|nr:MAG: 50S ribosomal protein L31e [Thermoprotei archaeon]